MTESKKRQKKARASGHNAKQGIKSSFLYIIEAEAAKTALPPKKKPRAA